MLYVVVAAMVKQVINPITKRLINVGSRTFKRLKRKSYEVFDLHDRTPGTDRSAIKKIPSYVVLWKETNSLCLMIL